MNERKAYHKTKEALLERISVTAGLGCFEIEIIHSCDELQEDLEELGFKVTKRTHKSWAYPTYTTCTISWGK